MINIKYNCVDQNKQKKQGSSPPQFNEMAATLSQHLLNQGARISSFQNVPFFPLMGVYEGFSIATLNELTELEARTVSTKHQTYNYKKCTKLTADHLG